MAESPVTASLQAMDLTTLRAVLAELRPLVLPSRFEKAQQSDGQTLQLGFRSLVGRHWLELSWQAEAPRLLAIAPPPRAGDGSTLFKTAVCDRDGVRTAAHRQRCKQDQTKAAHKSPDGMLTFKKVNISFRGGQASRRRLTICADWSDLQEPRYHIAVGARDFHLRA